MNLINLKTALEALNDLERVELHYLKAHQNIDELVNKCPTAFKATEAALYALGVAIDTAIASLNRDCEAEAGD